MHGSICIPSINRPMSRAITRQKFPRRSRRADDTSVSTWGQILVSKLLPNVVMVIGVKFPVMPEYHSDVFYTTRITAYISGVDVRFRQNTTQGSTLTVRRTGKLSTNLYSYNRVYKPRRRQVSSEHDTRFNTHGQRYTGKISTYRLVEYLLLLLAQHPVFGRGSLVFVL